MKNLLTITVMLFFLASCTKDEAPLPNECNHKTGELKRLNYNGKFYKLFNGTIENENGEQFAFSVNNSELAEEMSGLVGNEIEIYYKDEIIIPITSDSTKNIVFHFEER